MDKLSRRSLLRTLAGGALATTGTVVIARAAVTEAAAAVLPTGDLQERAARIAELGGEAVTQQAQLFVNGGIPLPGVFGNAPLFGNAPYFRNGGFPNGGGVLKGGGRFRNGGGVLQWGGVRNGGGVLHRGRILAFPRGSSRRGPRAPPP